MALSPFFSLFFLLQLNQGWGEGNPSPRRLRFTAVSWKVLAVAGSFPFWAIFPESPEGNAGSTRPFPKGTFLDPFFFTHSFQPVLSPLRLPCMPRMRSRATRGEQGGPFTHAGIMRRAGRRTSFFWFFRGPKALGRAGRIGATDREAPPRLQGFRPKRSTTWPERPPHGTIRKERGITPPDDSGITR